MRFAVFALVVGAAISSHSQETPGQPHKKSSSPFVQFDPVSKALLQPLHGQKSPLAWRKDFPGGWPAWRKAAREKLLELLGMDRMAAAAVRHRVNVKLGEVTQEDGYQRQLGEIETEPGVFIPFWVLTPTDSLSNKRPVALCAHGHDSDGWNTYAGVYRDEKHRRETLAKEGSPGVEAVRRGYIAVVPATRGLAKAVSITDRKGRHGNRNCRAQLVHCLLAGRTPMGERVWDSQRIIDWIIQDLQGVDAKKLVMLGNSGGGVLTLYTAALDDRVRVAIPSCSFTSFTSAEGFIFHCDCCLIPRAQSELCDLSDIGALAAPRALLAVHGRKDGLHHFDDVQNAMERVHLIYRAAAAGGRFEHRWGDQGHQFYPQFIWPFIEKQLEE